MQSPNKYNIFINTNMGMVKRVPHQYLTTQPPCYNLKTASLLDLRGSVARVVPYFRHFRHERSSNLLHKKLIRLISRNENKRRFNLQYIGSKKDQETEKLLYFAKHAATCVCGQLKIYCKPIYTIKRISD